MTAIAGLSAPLSAPSSLESSFPVLFRYIAAQKTESVAHQILSGESVFHKVLNGKEIEKKDFSNLQAVVCFLMAHAFQSAGDIFYNGSVRLILDPDPARRLYNLFKKNQASYLRTSSHYREIVLEQRGIDIPRGSFDFDPTIGTILIGHTREGCFLKLEPFPCRITKPVSFLLHGLEYLHLIKGQGEDTPEIAKRRECDGRRRMTTAYQAISDRLMSLKQSPLPPPAQQAFKMIREVRLVDSSKDSDLKELLSTFFQQIAQDPHLQDPDRSWGHEIILELPSPLSLR